MGSSIYRSLVTAPLALAICLAGLVARAEPPGGESSRASAQARLVEGVALLKRADYAGALAKFQDAYRLVPSPNIHYDLALAYAGLGRSADALDAFERFLSQAPSAPVATRQKAKADAETMRSRVAVLAISTAAVGSEILVDGVPRGVTPLSLHLDPGRHELAARGPGGLVGPVKAVVAEAGATLAVSLSLPAAVAGAATATIADSGGRRATAPPPAPGPPALLEKP